MSKASVMDLGLVPAPGMLLAMLPVQVSATLVMQLGAGLKRCRLVPACVLY